MKEGYKVADQEDCGCEGSNTVDEFKKKIRIVKQISTQTQSVNEARIFDMMSNNTSLTLTLTYTFPPSFPPNFQKR